MGVCCSPSFGAIPNIRTLIHDCFRPDPHQVADAHGLDIQSAMPKAAVGTRAGAHGSAVGEASQAEEDQLARRLASLRAE